MDSVRISVLGVLTLGSMALQAQAQNCDPVEIAQLTAPLAMDNDHFGTSLAAGGGLLVVGVPDDDEHGVNAGAVYIYRLNGKQWGLEAKIASIDIAEGDLFGNSVSISGDRILIGAPNDDDFGSNTGSAYTFTFDGNGWIQEAKLNALDARSTDFFGGAVSLSGFDAVVSAERNDANGTNAGAAYVFSFDGVQWNEATKLLASDGAPSDAFSESLSIDGDFIVVGAPNDDDNGNSSGAAYVFVRDGAQWVEQAKLIADDGERSDFFGLAVDISASTILIGAYWDDDSASNSGSVYVFDFDGAVWNQHTKLLASNGDLQDQFGFAVSISGNTAVVGANKADQSAIDSGSAYVFQRNGSQWSSGSMMGASNAESLDFFGGGVAIWNGQAMISAAGQDIVGADAGAVYIFGLGCPCRADLTGDGLLDFFDVSAFLNAFAANDPVADFTNDGLFNFFDVSAFLNAFSAGCL